LCFCSACAIRTLRYVAIFGNVGFIVAVCFSCSFFSVSRKALVESGQNEGGLLGTWSMITLARNKKKSTDRTRYLTNTAFAKSGKHRHCQRRGFKAFCSSRDFSLVTFF